MLTFLLFGKVLKRSNSICSSIFFGRDTAAILREREREGDAETETGGKIKKREEKGKSDRKRDRYRGKEIKKRTERYGREEPPVKPG